MTVLVAADLDSTLIYSRRWLSRGDPVTCVEARGGEPAAFMTSACADVLASVAASSTVVPVTTRTHEQYRRVRLPMPAPRYAVAANGALLYVDGSPDRSWTASVRTRLAGGYPFGAVWDFAAHVCHAEWTVKLRNADGLFCYAIVHPPRLPAGFVDDVAGWAAERRWRTSLQGRKLYWVPERLTKSAAVAEVARRCEADRLLAAGDSLLDVDLLLAADRGIHPAHGELFERGWSAPTVERTSAAGALAGQEIVTWFLANRRGEQ